MSKMLSKHESKCKCVECAAITPNQIVRYLDLVDRRLEILTSGVNWRPEYEGELAAIDKELAELRQLVDQEHQRRDQMQDNQDGVQDCERKMEPLPCDGKEVKEITGDCFYPVECDCLDFCLKLKDSQDPPMLELRTQYCTYDDVLLQVTRYRANNSLCVQAYNRTDGPIARLTVCLPGSVLAEDCAFLDTNNCPWVEDFIRQNHLGTDMGVMMSSGYCVYPLYKFDMVELNKYV